MSAKKRKLTAKQKKLVKGIIEGKTVTEAAREAGYSPDHPENAGQSGYQAIKQIGDRVRGVMDSAGLTLEQLIEKDLRSKLGAKEVKFFPFRKTVFTQPVDDKGKPKGDPIEDVIQVIDVRHADALGIQLGALDIAFRLGGYYAPKQIDTDPQSGDAPKFIYAGGIPRFND